MCGNSAAKKHRRHYSVGQPLAWGTKSAATAESAAVTKYACSPQHGQPCRANHLAEHTCPRRWSGQSTCGWCCYQHAYTACMRKSWTSTVGEGYAKQYTLSLDNGFRFEGQTLYRGHLGHAG